jgi:hypothetical protein
MRNLRRAEPFATTTPFARRGRRALPTATHWDAQARMGHGRQGDGDCARAPHRGRAHEDEHRVQEEQLAGEPG